MHIGSLPFVSGMSGKQDHPLLPGLSTMGWLFSSAGQSRIVAFAEMDIGAAVIALVILWAFVMLLPMFIVIGCDFGELPFCNAPSAADPARRIAVRRTGVRAAE